VVLLLTTYREDTHMTRDNAEHLSATKEELLEAIDAIFDTAHRDIILVADLDSDSTAFFRSASTSP
jgi:hypothetical protein